MGTRHLVAVMKDEEYKVAQYGQFDGYPSRAGTFVLEFLLSADLSAFSHKLENCKFMTNAEVNKLWEKAGAENGRASLEVSEKMKQLYPTLHRDTSADVLQIIYTSEDTVPLVNSIDFAGDSVFCEWAYVIDLDKHTFETYKGFNKTRLSKLERFYGFPTQGEHKPIRMVKSYSLYNLPTVDDFIKEVDSE